MIRLRLAALASIAAIAAAAPAAAQPAEFGSFVQDLRAEAKAQGISERALNAALTGIEPIPRVIELDRKQPEFTLTFQQYLDRTVTANRVARGRKLMNQHADLLRRVEAEYGVQPRFIVALWGMETDFGRITGGFPVIPALATLAWDGRRSAFFRKELMNALKIIDGGHIAADKMTGSWAGAMGQPQFMPSSFNNFAQDFDGDGRRDIWHTLPDVFASAANYLAKHGWHGDQTWGRPVTIPAGLDAGLIGTGVSKPLAEWSRLGIRRADGGPIPVVAGMDASLVRPEDGKGPAFLVYDNWRAIMKWNRSVFYATAVGILADRLGNL